MCGNNFKNHNGRNSENYYVESFAAARDGLDITIQNAVEGTSIAGGIFEIVSIPTIVGCIGAGIIIISSIIALFIKSQNVKEVLFFIMCAGIILKIITVEIARIIM